MVYEAYFIPTHFNISYNKLFNYQEITDAQKTQHIFDHSLSNM